MPHSLGADEVRSYHARSTHHPGRYAPGPGYLDWANQPEPFRTYAGAPTVPLPLAGRDLTASWDDLHRPGVVPPRPLDRTSLGAFFELALGLTAWKEHRGSRWALRANPSSGNLHPTEGYALTADTPGLPAGLYHYVSRDHVLERRSTPRPAGVLSLRRPLSGGVFLAGLASIHWREAWKYGERAFRYCQHDVGHALAALRYAAAVLGWSARLLETPGDDDVAALLGLDRGGDFSSLAPADREHPDCLVVVAPAAEVDDAARRAEGAVGALRKVLAGGTWAGVPNALSPDHVDWQAIADVAAATAKPRTAGHQEPTMAEGGPGATRLASRPGDARAAVSLIRGRRSALGMDGTTTLQAASFLNLLDRLLPRSAMPPWDALPWAPRVHPLLFVHRVDGLPPGLYLLERTAEAHAALRASVRPSFGWERPPGVPETLPFFLLDKGDARSFAHLASCYQEVASESAFAVAMLAELGPALDRGPWWYRRLHWEAGLLGQALYLEAEAAGVRGTGIGCFFDDVVHETLGLADERFRDLYHFTVGGAVEDPRLTTLPAYADAVERRG